jgi:hypothetical protein
MASSDEVRMQFRASEAKHYPAYLQVLITGGAPVKIDSKRRCNFPRHHKGSFTLVGTNFDLEGVNGGVLLYSIDGGDAVFDLITRSYYFVQVPELPKDRSHPSCALCLGEGMRFTGEDGDTAGVENGKLIQVTEKTLRHLVPTGNFSDGYQLAHFDCLKAAELSNIFETIPIVDLTIDASIDVQPAASIDVQPAAIDVQPSAIDVQPSAIDVQPAAIDVQPAASIDVQPAAIDVQTVAFNKLSIQKMRDARIKALSTKPITIPSIMNDQEINPEIKQEIKKRKPFSLGKPLPEIDQTHFDQFNDDTSRGFDAQPFFFKRTKPAKDEPAKRQEPHWSTAHGSDPLDLDDDLDEF